MAKETEGVGIILVIQNGIKINMKGKKTMKKTLRLLTAMVLTVFMVMSVSMTAFAVDDPTYTITMKRAAGDTTNHTYEAYQVFTGTLATISGQKQLTEIQWGSGVNSTSLLTALTSSTKFGSTNPFSSLLRSSIKRLMTLILLSSLLLQSARTFPQQMLEQQSSEVILSLWV